MIALRSAVFNPANDTITLIPRKAFALTRPVELTINGTSPSGVQDSSGQLIDGDDDGTAGGNAVAVIRRNGVTLNPVAPVPSSATIPIFPPGRRWSAPHRSTRPRALPPRPRPPR